MNEPRLNLPELTVSELSAALKRTVEDAYGYVRVRGEISGFKGAITPPATSISTSRTRAPCIDGVIWKQHVRAACKLKPEEGLEVVVTGRLTTYPGPLEIPDRRRDAGAGRPRRADGAARGAQAASSPPRACSTRRASSCCRSCRAVIGVVTSPTGAVIRDILHRLADRFPRHVLVWPVQVQGEGSAARGRRRHRRLQRAARTAARMPRPDLLIVARGGGSLEDLWSFNEEIVVRAAAASIDPADLRGRPRDRRDADRFRRRPARADADRGRRDGGAGARRADARRR